MVGAAICGGAPRRGAAASTGSRSARATRPVISCAGYCLPFIQHLREPGLVEENVLYLPLWEARRSHDQRVGVRLGLAGATSGIAVKTVVTAGELGVFGALDGVLVGQFGSFWTTRRTSSRNRAAAREQRELDRLSRSNERLESGPKVQAGLGGPVKASERSWSGCWLRARIRGAAVIEAPLTRQSLVQASPL
jgi:hypothetical protein